MPPQVASIVPKSTTTELALAEGAPVELAMPATFCACLPPDVPRDEREPSKVGRHADKQCPDCGGAGLVPRPALPCRRFARIERRQTAPAAGTDEQGQPLKAPARTDFHVWEYAQADVPEGHPHHGYRRQLTHVCERDRAKAVLRFELVCRAIGADVPTIGE